MEHKAFFKNKAGSNAVTTHSDTKRNIPKGLSFPLLFWCISETCRTKEFYAS
jgi:hypothetical protein